jgi:hypothetical protein
LLFSSISAGTGAGTGDATAVLRRRDALDRFFDVEFRRSFRSLELGLVVVMVGIVIPGTRISRDISIWQIRDRIELMSLVLRLLWLPMDSMLLIEEEECLVLLLLLLLLLLLAACVGVCPARCRELELGDISRSEASSLVDFC